MQRERRRDPYPWSWEIPVTVLVLMVLAMVVGIQVARSLANLAAGSGWTWPAADPAMVSTPTGAAFWSSVPGVLAGDSEAGLPEPVPADLAGPRLLWASLVTTELVLLALAVWIGVRLYVRWGPARMRGMATSAEAEKLLGVTRLRKVAAIVRPDLHDQAAGVAGQEDLHTVQAGLRPPSDRIGRRSFSAWLRNQHGGIDRG